MSMKDATELTAVLCKTAQLDGVRYSEHVPGHLVAAHARKLCNLAKSARRTNEWLLDHEGNEALEARQERRQAQARTILAHYGIALRFNSDPRGAAFELTLPTGGKWWV